MQIAICNDIHLSDKPPRWRKDNYSEQILDKVNWVVNYCNINNIDALAITGDTFHNPVPHRVSHYLVGELIDILSRLHCHLLMIPGNHDLGAGGIDELYRQPLSILSKALPNSVLLTTSMPDFNIGGYTIAGYEWKHDFNSLLSELPPPQSHTDSKHTMEKIDLLLLHAPVAKRGNPHYETIDAALLAPYAHCVAYGHLHAPDKPYTINGTLFVNPGALSRGSLTVSDIDRVPQIAVVSHNDLAVDKLGTSVEYVPIAIAKSPQDIFKIDEALFKKENDSVAAEKFVSSLNAAQLDRADLGSLIKIATGMTDNKEIAELCRQILTGVV